MIKRASLVLCAALLVALLMGAQLVYADDPTPTPTAGTGQIVYQFDFTQGQGGWAVTQAGGGGAQTVYTEGVGFVSQCSDNQAGNYVDYAYIKYTFASSFTVTYVDVLYDKVTLGVFDISRLDALLTQNGTNYIGDATWDSQGATGTGLHHVWSGSATIESDFEVFVADGINPAGCPGGSGAIIRGITIYGPSLPFPTNTATLTPSLTNTYYPSSTGQPAWSGFIPTLDSRPWCTLTPAATEFSYFGTTQTPQPSATWIGGQDWWNFCQSYDPTLYPPGEPTNDAVRHSCLTMTAVAYQSVTPAPSSTLLSPYGTVTPRPTVGDCRAPGTPMGGGPPQFDFGFGFEYSDTGTPAMNCYTILPDIHIYIPEAVQGIVNGGLSTPWLDATNSHLDMDGIETCFRYRRLDLTVMGDDWSSVVTLFLGLMTIGFIVFIVRFHS